MRTAAAASLSAFRQSFRLIRREKGFFAFAVLLLGCAMAAAATVFAVYYAVLLRQMPYPSPDELALVWRLDDRSEARRSSVHDFRRWKVRGLFQQVSASRPTFRDLDLGDRTLPTRAAGISEEFFSILGVIPAQGRTFTASEADQGPRLAILSDALWSSAFARAPGILGKEIQLRWLTTETFVVIGVLPAEFRPPEVLGLEECGLWLPLPLAFSSKRALQDPDGDHLHVLGRLSHGVVPATAAKTLTEPGSPVTVTPLRHETVAGYQTLMVGLLATSFIVLALVVANLTGIHCVKANARQGEFALRLALGARISGLVVGLGAETLLLALAGGLAGAVGTWSLLKLVVPHLADRMPRWHEVEFGWPVLGFIATAAMLAALLQAFVHFGTLAKAGRDLAGGLQAVSRGSSPHRAIAASELIVVLESALAVGLLGAGLLLAQSYIAIRGVDLGFRSEAAYSLYVAVPPHRMVDRGDATRHLLALVDRLKEEWPEAQASIVSDLPLGGRESRVRIQSLGNRSWGPEPEDCPETALQRASQSYFKTLGIGLVHGRIFGATSTSSHLELVVNQHFARRLSPEGSILGSKVEILDEEGEPFGQGNIVGIVEDVRHRGLVQPVRSELYVSYRQVPHSSANLVLTFPPAIPFSADSLGRIVYRYDPSLITRGPRSIESMIQRERAPHELFAAILGGSSLVGVLLAASGFYGLVAFVVQRSKQAIAIRISLGASPDSIVRLFVTRTTSLAAAGSALGVALAYALGQAFSSHLYQVSAADPKSLAAVFLSMTLIALAATLRPARQASRLDPAEVLRAE